LSSYVYCLVAAPRRPSLPRSLKGLPGTGKVRLLEITANAGARGPWWLAVADASDAQYGEARINERLSDLDWVAQAAVAHERVVEAFGRCRAVLPMKLFTIFESDQRAVAHVDGQRRRIKELLTRVDDHQEWGVRLTLDVSRARRVSSRPGDSSGAGYLRRKKAQRDAVTQAGSRAPRIARALFSSLKGLSRLARRRGATEAASPAGALILDAVFLVRRGESGRFRTFVRGEARALAPEGYAVALTGPWPPYSFMVD
jgi:hypothetical protein